MFWNDLPTVRRDRAPPTDSRASSSVILVTPSRSSLRSSSTSARNSLPTDAIARTSVGFFE